MQPRDAHDDGDCAMEEAGGLLHSSPLPAVMTNSKTDASSPSSSNQQQTNDEIREAAADALVGARKRKNIRVVKHPQVSLLFLNCI